MKPGLRVLTPVLALSLCLCADGRAGDMPSADPVCRFSKWGVSLVVHDLQWISSKREAGAPSSGEAASDLGDCLRLDVEIGNERQGTKLDLEDDLIIYLQDERGNRFFPLKDPFPEERLSLYPRTSIRRVVHFEPLLDNSRLLKLCLSGMPPQRSAVLSFLLPPERTREVAETGPLDFPATKDLKLSISPDSGQYLAGQSVRVSLKLPDDVVPPQRIFVMTPNQLVEDRQHRMEYLVNIPADQLPGAFTVVVMAKWGKEEEGYLVSRSVDLKIADLQDFSRDPFRQKNSSAAGWPGR